MTDEEILDKVMQKAVKNGFDPIKSIDPYFYDTKFAMAFWKDSKPVMVKVTNADGSSVECQMLGWQYWLSQVPLADNIYEFLARFLV